MSRCWRWGDPDLVIIWGNSWISSVHALARYILSLHMSILGLKVILRHSDGVRKATWRQAWQTCDTVTGSIMSSSDPRTNTCARISTGSLCMKWKGRKEGRRPRRSWRGLPISCLGIVGYLEMWAGVGHIGRLSGNLVKRVEGVNGMQSREEVLTRCCTT